MRHNGELSRDNYFCIWSRAGLRWNLGSSCAEMNINNISSWNDVSSFMKENPRVMDIKVTLDLELLRNRHFRSPSVHQQGWWPQSWAEEQRKTDRFLAELIYKFHWNHIIYSKDLYLKESSNLTKTCLFLSRCSWTCYSLMAHDRLPCLQISCRCQCFSFSC